MTLFSTLDLLALAFFLRLPGSAMRSFWNGPSTEKAASMRVCTSYRDGWMQQMLRRDMRMVDAQIMASLQNGTAFFASTSLIAVGGTLTILRSTDDLITIVSTLPFGVQTTRMLWEIKTIGLAVIFVYAFFKFAWSYRLYNYVAIMIGAMPPSSEKNEPDAQRHALQDREALRSGRPAFQSRPARILLRARLSRMVRVALAAVRNHRRYCRGDVGPAIHVRRQHCGDREIISRARSQSRRRTQAKPTARSRHSGAEVRAFDATHRLPRSPDRVRP